MKTILLLSTAMLSGRAMTLAFLSRIGNGGPGDPPIAWAMPLIGDAVIGLSGIAMVLLLLKPQKLSTWSILVVWNAIGIWDALSAYVIHSTVPWPEFFMIKIFGSSMFFMASAMHGLNIYLLYRMRQTPVLTNQYEGTIRS